MTPVAGDALSVEWVSTGLTLRRRERTGEGRELLRERRGVAREFLAALARARPLPLKREGIVEYTFKKKGK